MKGVSRKLVNLRLTPFYVGLPQSKRAAQEGWGCRRLSWTGNSPARRLCSPVQAPDKNRMNGSAIAGKDAFHRVPLFTPPE